MTELECGRWVSALISQNRLHSFYASAEWERLRKSVLIAAKNECAWCKNRGFYRPANTVHHVQFVRNHPELALSATYIVRGVERQNLVPLCRSCHERAHTRCQLSKPPLTNERW